MYEMCRDPVMRFQSRVAPCESSGSEHSGEESSLSDMVNSFMEQDFDELNDDQGAGAERSQHEDQEAENQDEARSNCKAKVELMSMMCVEKDPVKSCIVAEVDTAMRALEDSSSCCCCLSGSSPGLGGQLMTKLRARGLDAGLCKSKWQRQGHVPAGEHEYIDINLDNTRYIVELRLANHFAVARPTGHYASLLDTLPEIFVGGVEELKQVVKLMCKAMRVSMGTRDMQVPPWKKHEYMKAKWFGFCMRTLKTGSPKSVTRNMVAAVASAQGANRSVGFEVLIQNPNGQGCGSTCRYEIDMKAARMRHGLLAAAFEVQRAEI